MYLFIGAAVTDFYILSRLKQHTFLSYRSDVPHGPNGTKIKMSAMLPTFLEDLGESLFFRLSS